MKKYSKMLLMAVIAALCAVSCLPEDDDAVYTDAGMCEIITPTRLKMDSGLIYNIVSNRAGDLEVGMKRLMIQCDVLRVTEGKENEYDVDLLSYAQVVCKDVVRASEADDAALGDDAINIVEGWIENGYFNAYLQITGVTASKTEHLVNLVFNDVRSNSDTLYFEMRHNAYGESFDNPDISTADLSIMEGYTSFPITELRPAGSGKIVMHFDWEWFNIVNNVLSSEKCPSSGDLTYKY